MNGGSSRSAWPAVVIAGISMIVAGGLAIAHVDKEVLLLIMTISATPVITSLVSGQIGRTEGTVAAVQQQTNGNWAKALDVIKEQGAMLAATSPAPPAPAPEPAPAPAPAPAGPSTAAAPAAP